MVVNGLTRWLPNALPNFLRGSDSAFRQAQVNIARAATAPIKPSDFYAVLRAYYEANGLYRELQARALDIGLSGADLRSLRNPAQQIVEFWPVHLCPGDLPEALPIVPGDDVPDGDALMAAIEQVWSWSNWGAKKQLVARWLAMLGDVFVKVAISDDGQRVYFDPIDPCYVTDFETDPRGYLIWARIDVPLAVRQSDGSYERYLHTEEWDKAQQRYRRWRNAMSDLAMLTDLGQPEDERSFAEMGCDDFIPIRHVKFRDLGYLRGIGAYTLLLEKIDEVNRKATNASAALYRAPDETWTLEGEAKDASGFVPPLTIEKDGTVAESGPISVGRSRFLSLPPGWHLKNMVPDINFAALLDGVLADLRDLQRDAPEMLYWETAGADGVESGTARRMKLAPAIARVEEVRGNFESAMADLDAMACTIGKNHGLEPFVGLADFRAGGLEHTFERREVIPLTEQEEMAAEKDRALAAQAWAQAGLPLGEMLLRLGYSEERAAQVLAMAQQAVEQQSPPGQAVQR